MIFQITENAIDTASLKEELVGETAGAYVCFEGMVRNHNQGKHVTALEYEIYEELCYSEGSKILIEAAKQCDVYDIICVHRSGKLNIGDCAVWVGVSSSHRKAAYKASEYVIDNIKARLPIWKKEYYMNGDSGWVNCTSHEKQNTEISI